MNFRCVLSSQRTKDREETELCDDRQERNSFFFQSIDESVERGFSLRNLNEESIERKKEDQPSKGEFRFLEVMQLLVPPLEDSSVGDFGSNKTTDSSSPLSPRSRSVMSQGLQDKFETMTQAWDPSRATAAKRSESPEEEGEDSSHHDHHQNKKRKIAIDTAFAIESEMQKWQRGIAELEAMLEQPPSDDLERDSPSSSSKRDARARPPEVVRFPSLPPVIPAEEGDFEESCSNSEDDEDEDESQQNEATDGYDDEGSEKERE
ncbi:unnamed protein product [Cylindrotheca closterium]|uniref:Uncharacterized protein n=1 Tax=Cylindrotheca closterium TaxID=2856 RepID=A0AAD2CXX6_9STRA|nr:unnamed protein product [Cylindrotheca closterium]